MWQPQSESSKRKAPVFSFLSFLAPPLPLHTPLFVPFSVPTQECMNARAQKRMEISSFQQKAREMFWLSFSLTLLSDAVLNLGEKRKIFKDQ